MAKPYLVLAEENERHAIASIKRYFSETLDQDVGDLKASMMLEFILKEIGPSIYNGAIQDAQACMQGQVADLDGSCHKPEFGYWER